MRLRQIAATGVLLASLCWLPCCSSAQDTTSQITMTISQYNELKRNLTQLELNLEQLERQAIERAMRLSNGNMTRAAEYLGITRFALYRKIEKLGL